MSDTPRTSRGRRGRQAQPKPPYPDERLGNFVRGLLLGALIGLVLALLTTPRSGAATRADIRNRVEKARARGREVADEARLAVSDFAAWAAETDESLPPASADTLSLTAASPLVSRSKAPTGPLPHVSRTGEALPH